MQFDSSGYLQKNWSPLVPVVHLAIFKWSSPSVNQIEGVRVFDKFPHKDKFF